MIELSAESGASVSPHTIPDAVKTTVSGKARQEGQGDREAASVIGGETPKVPQHPDRNTRHLLLPVQQQNRGIGSHSRMKLQRLQHPRPCLVTYAPVVVSPPEIKNVIMNPSVKVGKKENHVFAFANLSVSLQLLIAFRSRRELILLVSPRIVRVDLRRSDVVGVVRGIVVKSRPLRGFVPVGMIAVAGIVVRQKLRSPASARFPIPTTLCLTVHIRVATLVETSSFLETRRADDLEMQAAKNFTLSRTAVAKKRVENRHRQANSKAEADAKTRTVNENEKQNLSYRQGDDRGGEKQSIHPKQRSLTRRKFRRSPVPSSELCSALSARPKTNDLLQSPTPTCTPQSFLIAVKHSPGRGWHRAHRNIYRGRFLVRLCLLAALSYLASTWQLTRQLTRHAEPLRRHPARDL